MKKMVKCRARLHTSSSSAAALRDGENLAPIRNCGSYGYLFLAGRKKFGHGKIPDPNDVGESVEAAHFTVEQIVGDRVEAARVFPKVGEEQIVQVVQVTPPERPPELSMEQEHISERIFSNRAWKSRFPQVAEQFVTRFAVHVVAVPVHHILKANVEATSWAPHGQLSDRMCNSSGASQKKRRGCDKKQ